MHASSRLVALLAGLILCQPLFAAIPVQLGDAPTAPTPEQVARLRQRGPIVLGPGTFYSVNTTSREDVRNFFNTVYQGSETFSIGWTGDLGSCTPGTTDPTFRGLVALRINFFRAMAGIPAGITLDDTFGAKNQQAALMMSANNSLSHYPPTTWTCYTTDGYDAAGNSNLALGNAGPDAITAYIDDFGGNNAVVGHRRWILYPQTQTMGTGDVPDTGPNGSANSTWVFDGNFGGPRPTTRDGFVNWPPPGYVPYPVAFPRWSVSYPNANFTSATVTMSTNGVNIPVTKEPVQNGAGENTLVWYPTGLNTSSHYDWPRPAVDTVYSVNVQGVTGSGVPASFNYTVTVFDPQVPGPDSVVPVISGADQPAVGISNSYTFNAVTNATGYQWRQAQSAAFSAVEGAENGLAYFTTNTAPDYNVIISSPKASGNFAFHLAHPEPPEDQVLTYTRVLLPGASGQMQFKSRLGYAGSAQVAKAQISVDQGASWQDAFSQAGSDGPGEATFSTKTVSLAALAGKSILVRFAYQIGIGSYFNQTSTSPLVGWAIDDITFSDVEEVTNLVVTDIPSGASFAFVPAQVTNYVLNVRAQLYNEFYLEWGPVKRVTSANVVIAPVVSVATPAVSGTQLLIEFNVANAVPNLVFQLLTSSDLSGVWSTDSTATLQTVTPNTRFRFSTPLNAGPLRFYRVQAN